MKIMRQVAVTVYCGMCAGLEPHITQFYCNPHVEDLTVG